MNHKTRHHFLQTLAFAVVSTLASPLLAQDEPLKEGRLAPLDVLIIAPHPDDEVIGCAGVMLQALEQHKRVGVVVITNGDGHPALAAAVAKKDRDQLTPDDFMKAGALRQQHSVNAMKRLGVPMDGLIFLGYPDSGLEKIYSTAGTAPLRQMFTQKSETYGVTVRDYHSSVHGRPAPYLKANVVGDLAEIIRDRQPKEIYVTHEADTHSDHRAAFWFVRDAIRAANYQGDFFTYVVHGAPPQEPPSRRVTLTPAQVETKRAAIFDHQQGTSPVHDRLADEYTRPEEHFWRIHDQEGPDWVLEGKAAWQARDSQAEWVFRDQLWIGGGWFQSFEAPPRDVWSSGDGKEWKLIEKNAPWLHSDLPMNITFADKMWIMGGWYKGRLPGHSASNQVWSSSDGMKWEQVTASAGWTPRLAAGLVEHRGRMWMLGGTENYYFGDETSLKNDVWSSADGKTWNQETAKAAWSPRGHHQAVTLNDRMYVMGGGNYVPTYHAKNDVWSSSDGVNWTCETEAAPWEPRLWFSAAVYRGRMWVLGGWAKEKDNFGDVWHSADGKNWQRLETKTCWKARHEHSAFVFKDKLWIAGGHARPLSNEVWSLSLPPDWKPKADTATLPVLTLPVRVHLVQSETMPAMHTTLVESDVRRIMGKVNKVWSQAGIQFEIESIGPTSAVPMPPEMRLKPEFDRVHSMIPKDRLSPKAIDICYVKEVQPNGFYYGEPVVVKDTAKLREVPGGLDEPLPRVTSHEIGHALGLKHRQDTTNLMQSGTTGFSLNEAEIAIARKKAQEYRDKR